jgi:hypothetical protein
MQEASLSVTGTSAAAASPAGTRYVLVRDRHAAALEVSKSKAHVDSLERWQQKLNEYNALLVRPCHFALHL